MHLNTIQFIFAAIAGTLSSYLAHKAGKNPMKWFGIGAALGFFGILPIFFLAGSRKRPIQEPRIKSFFIDGPKEKHWYYLDRAQNQQGPMSYTALNNAWKEGKLDSSTYIWHEDLSEWKLLQDFIKTQG